MTLIRASDCENFDLPGIRFTSFATPRRGSTEIAAWRVTIGPGTPGTPHQLTRLEIVHAIRGRAVATIAGQSVDVGPGDTLLVPPHTDFSLANHDQTEFEAIAVLPAGGQALTEGAQAFTPPWAL